MFQKEIADLDIRDIMDYDPDNGNIFINHSRVVIYDTHSIGLLRRDLTNILGFERARGFMFRYGWNRGAHDAKIVGQYKCKNDLEWLRAGARMHQMQGFAKVNVLQAHLDVENESILMEGIWENSYECEEYLKSFKKSVHPVCATMTGYASGFVSTSLNKQVIFKEVKCRAMGDPFCYMAALRLLTKYFANSSPTLTAAAVIISRLPAYGGK